MASRHHTHTQLLQTPALLIPSAPNMATQASSFYNAFVADGIIPEQYGRRTVAEHRSQLVTLPPVDDSVRQRNSADPAPAATMRSRGGEGGSIFAAPAAMSETLRNPSTADVEDALRALAGRLDVSGMSALDPRFLAVLQTGKPMMQPREERSSALEGGGSSAARRAPSAQKQPPSLFRALVDKALEIVMGPRSRVELPRAILAWHWADELVACVSRGAADAICVYDFRHGAWDLPPLRSPKMRNVTCISFRPFAGPVIAAGCEAGIAIWSKQNVFFLQSPGHFDIVSLDWSPDGAKLATASARDGTVRLWDVGSRQSVFVGKGGLVRFCPQREKALLFVSSATTAAFRIWSYDTWKAARLGSLAGPVTAAEWSADGSTLMVSSSNESALHVLRVNLDEDAIVTESLHAELTGVPREGPGGSAQFISWDPSGERVAVSFPVPDEDEDVEPLANSEHSMDEHGRYAVSLYAAQLHPGFRMAPIGYIRGPAQSGPPVALQFKQRCGRGSLLAVAWANGEISFTQLLFSPPPSGA